MGKGHRRDKHATASPLPETPKSRHWLDAALESPKLWGALGLLALAPTFSPKLSAYAAWFVICLAWMALSAMVYTLEPVRNKPTRSRITIFFGIVFALSLVAYGKWLSPATETEIIKAVNGARDEGFGKEFNLGYKVFGIANQEFLAFQGPPNLGFLVHWERRGYSVKSDGDTVILRLPDIDLQPNMLMHGVTVSLPASVGSSVTFSLDPKSFRQGAAIMSNVFERTNQSEPVDVQPVGGANLVGFPAGKRIVYVMQSTVRWGREDSYQLGEVGEMGDSLKVSGGTLETSDVNVFDDALLVMGNRFIGGPRGGYNFPKAGKIINNVFSECIFDASRLPDNAIVANNRFSSSSGIYRIGPQPEVSFVVRIVKTEEYGTVLIFGAKPYTEQ